MVSKAEAFDLSIDAFTPSSFSWVYSSPKLLIISLKRATDSLVELPCTLEAAWKYPVSRFVVNPELAP